MVPVPRGGGRRMTDLLQDEIMGFLLELQIRDIIYISNNDEACQIGEQIWNILRKKEK